MKKVFTLIIALACLTSLHAQNTVDISTGASYANEVYYSLSDGEISSTPRDQWDLAFGTDGMDINILANSGAATEVYTYPDGNTSAWDNVDITNIDSWAMMSNSADTWTEGALIRNKIAGDDFDYGWGRYNISTHQISGDSLFVVKTTAGNYKKLWIVNKNPISTVNQWEIKYANIDGSDEQHIFINANDYSDKQFVFFSMENNELIDIQPETEDWDLLFTKYFDPAIQYYVSGVLSNDARISVQQIDAVIQDEYEDYEESEFSASISTIGYDWKTVDYMTGEYAVNEARVYFIKELLNNSSDSTYWKLYFTGFGGSENGNYNFIQKNLDPTLNFGENNADAIIDVFPNPTQESLNLVIDGKGERQIHIYDINGRRIYSSTISINGLSKHKIQVSHLARGVYNIVVSSQETSFIEKFIKE
jgi:hypothetical protein